MTTETFKTPTTKIKTSQKAPCLFTLRIELAPNDIQPVIWRRLEVDGRVSLGKLHHFIQAAFGWTDAHLHQFRIGDHTYGIPDPENDFPDIPVKDERKISLNQLLSEDGTMTYTYDFGDNWEHVITVESFTDDLKSDPSGGAWVIDGQRACPPEDVGGTSGYSEFLETLLVEPYSEEARAMREWVGGKFDPLHFDIRMANAAIFRMLYNGWGGK